MVQVESAQSNKISISLDELIYPLFVKEGHRIYEQIHSMPGVYKFSPDRLLEEVVCLQGMGLKNILLFGVPKDKDWRGTSAYKRLNLVSKAVRLLKSNIAGITIFTDICLCAYTSHGHCGIIEKGKRLIDKAATLKALSSMALSHAQAGADFVAPSAMAKGQVKAIRKVLDKAGYSNTKIMGYSAKFASNFYGPFRDIADSAPRFGDRRSYQLDYSKTKAALREVEQDIKEGADIVMVKPALGYLDIVKEVKTRFNHPLAVYNVSGEYSLVKKGAGSNFWDEEMMVWEILTSIKRAGADFIITYHAKDIARWFKEK